MKGIFGVSPFSTPIWKKPKMDFYIDGWDYEDFWRMLNDIWNNNFAGDVIAESLIYLCEQGKLT